MSQRFIDGTALLSIKWTVQKLDNVDRTHLALLDSATKTAELGQLDCGINKIQPL